MKQIQQLELCEKYYRKYSCNETVRLHPQTIEELLGLLKSVPVIQINHSTINNSNIISGSYNTNTNTIFMDHNITAKKWIENNNRLEYLEKLLKCSKLPTVYIVIEEPFQNRIKIGHTYDRPGENTRLRQLQTGNASKLKIYKNFIYENCKEVEIGLHKKYKERKITGEWFKMTMEETNNLCAELSKNGDKFSKHESNLDDTFNNKQNSQIINGNITINNTPVEYISNRWIEDNPPKQLEPKEDYYLRYTKDNPNHLSKNMLSAILIKQNYKTRQDAKSRIRSWVK